MAQIRSEWKYICTDQQLEQLRSRLGCVLQSDPHAGPEGSYQVHSLYFDDHLDSCASENESGDGLRYKYRIRFYGKEGSGLHLERKEKRYGLGGKKSCPLAPEEYDALLKGEAPELFWKTDKPLLKDLCVQIMTRYFSPKVIIDYDRTAFTDPAVNVRITLDRNITAAYDWRQFRQGAYCTYLIPDVHQNILEVKFDEILPGWLRQLIESLNVQQTAFSKYYLGRKRLSSLY